MRGTAFAAAALLAAAGTAAAAPAQPIGDETGTAAIVVEPTAAAARPTTVSLTLRGYPLVCGRTRAGTIAVTFPRAERLPTDFATGAVRVSNGLVRSTSIVGHTVTIAVAPVATGGVTCQSITLGRLTVTFTRAAKLGNPNSAGTYTVTAKHGTATYAAQFQVSA